MCFNALLSVEDSLPSLKDKSSKVLDLGCGLGKLGDTLCNAGFSNLYGLEKTDSYIKIASERGSYKKVEKGIVGKTRLPPEHTRSFDVVFCTSQLVRNINPTATFKFALSALKSQGLFIFALKDSSLDPDTQIWKGF